MPSTDKRGRLGQVMVWVAIVQLTFTEPAPPALASLFRLMGGGSEICPLPLWLLDVRLGALPGKVQVLLQ